MLLVEVRIGTFWGAWAFPGQDLLYHLEAACGGLISKLLQSGAKLAVSWPQTFVGLRQDSGTQYLSFKSWAHPFLVGTLLHLLEVQAPHYILLQWGSVLAGLLNN